MLLSNERHWSIKESNLVVLGRHEFCVCLGRNLGWVMQVFEGPVSPERLCSTQIRVLNLPQNDGIKRCRF